MRREASPIAGERKNWVGQLGFFNCEFDYPSRMEASVTIERNLIPELMDAPDVEKSAHVKALAGIRRLNWAARVPQVMAKPIRRELASRSVQQATMLDVACGSGDVPLTIARLVG